MTWNITLVIKGQERPKQSFAGMSQHHTVPNSWAGLSVHSYFKHAPLLCDKITGSRHKSYSHGIALAQELSLNHLQATSRQGITEQNLPCFHIPFMHLNWVVHAQCLTGTCFTLLFPASSKMPCRCLCFSTTAWAKWAGPHQSKEEVPSSLKPHPWTCAVATCPVLPLEFTQWYSRSAFSLYK